MILNAEIAAAQDNLVLGARDIEAQLAVGALDDDLFGPLEGRLKGTYGCCLGVTPRFRQIRDVVRGRALLR